MASSRANGLGIRRTAQLSDHTWITGAGRENAFDG